MATTTSILLLLLLLFSSVSLISSTPPTTTPSSSSSYTSFIHTSCKSTRYPLLCSKTLSSYAPKVHHSPRALATTALSVSLRHAQSACSLIDHVLSSPTFTTEETSTPKSRSRSPQDRAKGAVKDCIETMSDGVDRIRRSIEEMGHMGKAGSLEYGYHMSNVQTWVSAALTDENTCLDGLKSCKGLDGKVRDVIRKKIVGVAMVTSNALALVNKVA